MTTPAQMSRRTVVQEKLPDGRAMRLFSSSLEALASRKQGTHIYTLIIIIIIIIIIIFFFSFIQGIFTYIPETNYVPTEYSVAAILLLLFMVLISLVSVLNPLYLYISTFRSMCAVPNMAVFCSSLTSCFLVCCSRIF